MTLQAPTDPLPIAIAVRRSRHRVSMTADPILERVRKLLAKAEHASTPPAEAEAFSEKAAALIARYAIDDALLAEAGSSRGTAPELRTFTVSAPYALPKAVLLSQVASAHRVRVVIGGGAGEASRSCSLVGFPLDLEMTELLYTSLLLQATSAVLAATRGGGSDVRSYRRAFLLGFASRVGVRLRELAAAAAAESTPTNGRPAALVLASREDAVAAALREQFPHLRPLRQEVSNRRGLLAGTTAGSQADLGSAQSRLGARRRELGG